MHFFFKLELLQQYLIKIFFVSISDIYNRFFSTILFAGRDGLPGPPGPQGPPGLRGKEAKKS